MSKALVVLWESHRDSKTQSVILADNQRQANSIAASLRANRRRRVDVIPLTGATLKTLS